MVLSHLFRVASFVLVLSTTLSAQNPFGAEDPFGPAGADPFAVTEESDKADAPRKKAKPKSEARKAGSQATQKSSCDRVRTMLDDDTSFSFIELPLEDAARYISDLHDIPVILDRRSLKELGITADSPITLSLKNVSLRSALRLMLRDLDLTYMVRDEVLQITSPEQAEGYLEVRIYKLPEILADKSEKVMEAMQRTVHTDLWEITGGPCTAALVDHVIVVSGTEQLHEEVAEFLEMLAAAFE
jgi:hypothetical protein